MDWQTEFDRRSLDDLEDLPPEVSSNILRRIQELQKTSFASPQIRQLKGYHDVFRLRVGDYRVVYRCKGNRVTVLLVAHRKDVYCRLARLPKS